MEEKKEKMERVKERVRRETSWLEEKKKEKKGELKPDLRNIETYKNSFSGLNTYQPGRQTGSSRSLHQCFILSV